jgi:integrase
MNTFSNAGTEPVQKLDRRALSIEDVELLDDFDRNVSAPKGSYSVEFTDTTMVLAGRHECNIQNIMSMNSETVSGFKLTIKAVGMSGSRSPGTVHNYVNRISAAVRDASIVSFSPDTYPRLVNGTAKETVTALRSILNVWYRLGYPGVSTETFEVVNAMRRPAPQGRKRITSDDPTEGWYTTQEYDDLIDAYWTDYESGKKSLRNTAALLLVGQFGKRGIQLANLKVCDFQSDGETEGLSGKRIAFPGAKDRSAEDWFRGSKFEVHPMGNDLWSLCMRQIENTVASHETLLGRTLTYSERNEMPFFQKENGLKKALASFTNGEPDSVLHHTSQSMSTLFKRIGGTKVISHRTGEPVREFAYRMRYTRARQLARMGIPRTTLQYWLGHEDAISLDHYYDDSAEDARLLDLEMHKILAPLAQAFSGSLRDRESDAIRGNDPSSRIELDGRRSVGTCGEHGFCSASVPIPCYRCSKFQPWVDAPHEEVLIRLLERQEEENNIHLPSKSRRVLVPLQLEKDITAVKLVIKLCDARKQELMSSADESKKQPEKKSVAPKIKCESEPE